MPIDALQDFTTLTGAFGQFTQSLNQLQQMKIKVESEKASYAIGQANADFIKRMNLPFGDPNRITTDNFREALEAHQSQVDSFVDNINSPGVKAAVGGAVQQAQSQFDGTIMDHFMPLYVAEVQAKDTSLINDMANNPPSDPAALPAWKAQLDAKMDDSAKLGIYDPAKMQAIRDSVDTLTNGRIEANKALVAAGGDMDKAATNIAYGDGIDDRYRKSALDVLTAQAQNNEATITNAVNNLTASLLDGTASEESLAVLQKSLDSARSAFRVEMSAKITAILVNAKISEGSNYTSMVLSDKNRTYSSVWYAKDQFAQTYDEEKYKHDKVYQAGFDAQLDRYDQELARLKSSPEAASKEAYSYYQRMMYGWKSGGRLSNGRVITGGDVIAAAARLTVDDPVHAGSAMNDLANLGIYSGMLDANATKNATDIIAMLTEATKNDPTLKGVDLKKDNDKVNIVVGELMARQMAWLAGGTVQSPDSQRKHLTEMALPYLRNWAAINRTPTKGMFGDDRVWSQIADQIDSGALDALGSTKDPWTGRPIGSDAFSPAMAVFRSRAQTTMASAIQSGIRDLLVPGTNTPINLTPVPKGNGDIEWLPDMNGDGNSSPKVRFAADMVNNVPGDPSRGKHMAITKISTMKGQTTTTTIYDPNEAQRLAIKEQSDNAAYQMWNSMNEGLEPNPYAH